MLAAWAQREGKRVIIVIMGVTGAGKSTVGRLLAEQLGWNFEDGDDFHPAANVKKMRRGISLSDEDRWPWLEKLREELATYDAGGQNLVLACSALKKEYRNMLHVSPAVRFVYLRGESRLVAERLEQRSGHFADEAILAGQFADLEEPDNAAVTEIAGAPQEIVGDIRKKLGV